MSTRTRELLQRIPGFDKDIDTYDEDQDYDDFEENEMISERIFNQLDSSQVSLTDIVVVEDESSNMSSPYLVLEDKSGTPFYAIVDVDMEDLSVKPGTPIYTTSSIPGPASFSLKTMSVESNVGSVRGSMIECDNDGLCFIRDNDGKTEESYFRKKSFKGDEENPMNVIPVVSLKQLLEAPEVVLKDVKNTYDQTRKKMKSSCIEKMDRNRVALKDLEKSFAILNNTLSKRFETLDVSSEVLEKKIEMYRLYPKEEYLSDYKIAIRELDIRKNQYRDVVNFCELTSIELFSLFNNVNKEIQESIKFLNAENETATSLYSITR